jgi:hypothetical protein
MFEELHVTEQLCPVTVQGIYQRSGSSVEVALIKQRLWYLPVSKRITGGDGLWVALGYRPNRLAVQLVF